jgi:hypothetical protein
MVILRATSILGGQKEDNGIMCSITQFLIPFVWHSISHFNPVFLVVKLKLENEDKTIPESKTINRHGYVHSREAMEHLSKKHCISMCGVP